MSEKKKKYLLIVESPTKVKTITKYLPSEYVVEASVGHVRQIASKPGSVTLKNGSFEFKWDTDITKINKIITLAKKVDKIILATDMDREGEAIAYHLLNILKENNINTDNYERIYFTEITQKAILEAIKSPRLLNNNLVNAQLVRAGLDYIVGYTLSPLLWFILKSFGNKQSAGRVQSAALRLLVEKELERKKFNSNKYYSIEGNVYNDQNNIKVDLKSCNIEYKTLNSLTETEANNIYEYISSKSNNYVLSHIYKDIKMINAKPPLITSTLQQEASTQLNQKVESAMKNAQKLYELGYITYHRSDSTYMADEAIKSIRDYISAHHKEYLSVNINKYDKKSKNAQEAHECIRPTNIAINTIPELDKYHNDLYTLIRNRAIESQMSPAQQEHITYIFQNEDIQFQYKESHIIIPSFYVLYENVIKDERLHLPLNMEFILKELTKNEHNTKPPKRYTEASLIKQLETLGIGRPSTIANIFKVLQLRDYISYNAKSIETTFKGLCTGAFLATFFANYVDYNFTSEMERQLDEIVNGLDYTSMLENSINTLTTLVNNVKQVASGQDISIQEDSILHNISSRDQIIEKIGEYMNISVCKKCNGSVILHQTYHFYGICQQCHDNINLQIETHDINESIQIINTGKYRYIQLAETKVYLPDCVDNNITEQDVKNMACLAKDITYNNKKFTIGKTFTNFFICNEDKQYFNFNDVQTLHAALNLHEYKDTDQYVELQNYIYNNILQKKKYISKTKKTSVEKKQ